MIRDIPNLHNKQLIYQYIIHAHWRMILGSVQGKMEHVCFRPHLETLETPSRISLSFHRGFHFYHQPDGGSVAGKAVEAGGFSIPHLVDEIAHAVAKAHGFEGIECRRSPRRDARRAVLSCDDQFAFRDGGCRIGKLKFPDSGVRLEDQEFLEVCGVGSKLKHACGSVL